MVFDRRRHFAFLRSDGRSGSVGLRIDFADLLPVNPMPSEVVPPTAALATVASHSLPARRRHFPDTRHASIRASLPSRIGYI